MMSIQIKNIIPSIPYKTIDFIRCRGKHMEKILGRIRLAFVRCPKCKKHIGIYQDEISANGQTKIKKCFCLFKNSFILKNW